MSFPLQSIYLVTGNSKTIPKKYKRSNETKLSDGVLARFRNLVDLPVKISNMAQNGKIGPLDAPAELLPDLWKLKNHTKVVQ